MSPSPLWLFPARPARQSSAFIPGTLAGESAWALLLPGCPSSWQEAMRLERLELQQGLAGREVEAVA